MIGVDEAKSKMVRLKKETTFIHSGAFTGACAVLAVLRSKSLMLACAATSAFSSLWLPTATDSAQSRDSA